MDKNIQTGCFGWSFLLSVYFTTPVDSFLFIALGFYGNCQWGDDTSSTPLSALLVRNVTFRVEQHLSSVQHLLFYSYFSK